MHFLFTNITEAVAVSVTAPLWRNGVVIKLGNSYAEAYAGL